MIFLEDVTYYSKHSGVKKLILESASLAIPTDKVIALVANSTEDRLAMVHLLSGVIPPERGVVIREEKVSFPGDLAPAFDNTISLRNNLEYVARLYGASPRALVTFFDQIVGLGTELDKLLVDFSRDFRKHFAQIVPLSLPFDVYVTHGLSRGGPARLFQIAEGLLEVRCRQNGVIIGHTTAAAAARQCQSALVVHNGNLSLVENLDRAFAMIQ
jgi:capsular polysaccharide transport system ATP-binding protein